MLLVIFRNTKCTRTANLSDCLESPKLLDKYLYTLNQEQCFDYSERKGEDSVGNVHRNLRTHGRY